MQNEYTIKMNKDFKDGVHAGSSKWLFMCSHIASMHKWKYIQFTSTWLPRLGRALGLGRA